MKNYEAEKLKKIIVQKENAMSQQVKETDRLRKLNLFLKSQHSKNKLLMQEVVRLENDLKHLVNHPNSHRSIAIRVEYFTPKREPVINKLAK